MNKEKSSKIIIGTVAIIVLIFTFYIGNFFGEKKGREKVLSSLIPGSINISSDQFAPFWKVWTTLNEKFVEATTTDSEKRVYGAIQGLANSQGDPYTVFFPPEENKAFKSDISGKFEGVGMELAIKDGILTVVAPLKDSPAYTAGVKSGDKIIKINDKSAVDMNVEAAVKIIRGTAGTIVKIVFLRDGSNEPIEKTLTRAIINIPTIEIERKSTSKKSSPANSILGEEDSDVYVIKLFSFSAESPTLFRTALRGFLESGKRKLIIDLRNNPGGYLDAAWDMASWFLPAGKIIVTEDFGGKSENKIYKSKGYDVLNKVFGKDYKIAILVNNGSASASEILAGALQEHDVAKLVGIKTFGKGSVQELVEITKDTSLKVTIARWLTPKGHNLSHDGLKPDYEIVLTAKDIEAKRDPQMDKAVEILKN